MLRLRGQVIDANFGPGKQDYISNTRARKSVARALRQTGDEKYLKLAKFFMDVRGKDGYPRTGEYAMTALARRTTRRW